VVAVSEGIHDASGQPIMAQLAQRKGGTAERDAHGNVQLSGSGALADLLCEEIKARLGIKRVRGDTFGYLQRSFLGCVSDVDAREARDVGAVAVRMAIKHGANGSVAIRRDATAPGYVSEYALQGLEVVAAKTRVMDAAFISDAGNDVTPAFVDYLRPLLGSGVPQAERLRGRPVAQRLKPQA
jgi:6-phosphofructokinase 1